MNSLILLAIIFICVCVCDVAVKIYRCAQEFVSKASNCVISLVPLTYFILISKIRKHFKLCVS